jgi:hypothetical protein
VSPFLREAFDRIAEVRAEYEELLYSAYLRAEETCNARLLNRRGEAAGIDPISLFMGSSIRARAYASEELLEHWQKYPRITFESYERQRFESAPEGAW